MFQHPDVMAAHRALAQHSSEADRIAHLMRTTTKNAEEARRLLREAEHDRDARRVQALGFVRVFALGMNRFGYIATALQALLGIGLLGFALALGDAPWILRGVLVGTGAASLFWARSYWRHVRSDDPLQG